MQPILGETAGNKGARKPHVNDVRQWVPNETDTILCVFRMNFVSFLFRFAGRKECFFCTICNWAQYHIVCKYSSNTLQYDWKFMHLLKLEHQYVYALSGINFCSFAGSITLRRVSNTQQAFKQHEEILLQKEQIEPAWTNQISQRTI